ncbi:MAG: DNA polymerase III subunit beta [Alphaproteobacteria bacterium]|nr:DNA polymerase III subunit beta [Alphaproteobacteria bacterium]
MKLTIERGLLLKALSHIQSVVERRQTIPVLSNVLIETQGDIVSLRATDNEIEIVEKLPAGVETQGAVTIPAHKLYDIVKKLPEGSQLQMAYVEETGQVSLVSGRSKFALSTLPADGFPSMMMEETPFSFSVNAKDMVDLIAKTGFAVSMEETRYNLNGIYMHEKKGAESKLTAVATDGHRLACAGISLPQGAEGMPGVIIPRKTINELAKLAGETEDAVQVSLSANQIRFSMGDVVLSSRLIDGTYPDYEKVIPINNDKKLQAHAETLTDVIERVSVVSEKSRGIKLSLSNGLLQVFAASVDEGSAEDEMDAVYDGESVEIGFNYRYLLDILGQVKSETVQMYLQDSASPVILQDEADDNALYVLMPMRV